MSRTVKLGVLLLLLTLSSSAWAASGLISGGVTNVGNGPKPYIYGEFELTRDVAIGLDYNPQTLTVSLWSGSLYGFYAEGAWRLAEGGHRSTEAGVWAYVHRDSKVDVTAWGGVKSFYGQPGLRLTLNAEGEVPLVDTVSAVAGVGTTLLGENNKVYAWLGALVRF